MSKQQKSQNLPIKWSPRGGLDMDSSPLAINSGNYQDCINLNFLTQLGSTTVCLEVVKGNSFSFALPFVPTQDKVFRIYLEYPSPTQRTLKFYDGNGVLLGMANYTPVTSLAATYAAAAAAINTALGAGNVFIGSLVVTSTNATGYFSFQISTVPFWNYSLTLTGEVDEPLPIVTSEAINSSLSGALRFIGSYDLSGDGIIWSTNQANMPSQIAIAGISNNAGAIRVGVQYPPDSTLSILDQAEVTITGADPSYNINGVWIVSIHSLSQFDLLGSVFAAGTGSMGTININVNGLGEVGVAVYDENSSTWNYTTLLRSRELNFRTKKQPKTVCERNNLSANLYWTDNYNPYRRLYYQGAYQSNGALNYVDSSNLYFYDEIDLQTRLFQQNGLADINFSAQLQSGGGLYAGNYRYIVRFLDEFFNPSLWTDPSGIFVVSRNAVSPNTQSIAAKIFGNNSVDQTSKINQMLLTGIIPNLFKYVEVGALFYVDGTTVPISTIVNRILLAQTPTQIIQHTGNETNIQTLDINSLQETQPDILRGLGIDIVANRLIPSNTTGHQDINLQTWFDAMTYDLAMGGVQGIGVPFYNQLNVGEYQISENTFDKMGFMLNETYRISGKPEFLNGAFGENFFFSDITFNKSATSPDGKRTGGLPFMDLTSNTAQQVYVPYVNITNIDWDFTIDSVPVKNIVKRIHWEMVEMVSQFREILGSGAVAMGSSFPDIGGGNFEIAFTSDYPCTSGLHTVFQAGGQSRLTTQDITENPFVEGFYIEVGFDEDPYNSGSLNSEREFMSFYAPDILFGSTDINWDNGDQLIVFGAPSVRLATSVGTASNHAVILNAEKEFSGFVNDVANTSYTVSEVVNVDRGGTTSFASLGGGRLFQKNLLLGATYTTPPPMFAELFYPATPVLNTSSNVNYQGPGADYGFYMAQYYRPKTNKFGDKSTSKYIPTGATTEYLSVDAAMYGDTFNQKTWFKRRQINSFINPNSDQDTCSSVVFTHEGFGGGIAFYSQNRVNSQMINRTDSGVAWSYPDNSLENWLTNLEPTEPLLIYNSGYNSQQGVTNDVAFDPNLPNNPSTPARFWWSLNKPENSIADLYTVILPLNFRDEDLTNGDIWHTIIANSNLYTFQRRSVVRQYIEDTSLVQSTSATVVFGSSGVATQRGDQLSGYGTIHGFGVIKGKSAGGKDTFYWIDTFTCKVMRFEPSDGTKCLSDDHNMRWFFNNYLQFTNEALTPADGQGICGAWDDQHSEAVWTVRAKKSVDTFMYPNGYDKYDEVFFIPPTTLQGFQTGGIGQGLILNEAFTSTNGATGNIGSLFSNGQTTVYSLSQPLTVGVILTGLTSGVLFHITGIIPPVYSTFEQTGEIYISLIDNNNTSPIDTTAWQLVPHFGSDVLANGEYPYDYYNEYTIAYSEVKDKFVTRYSFLPMIYIKVGKQFLTPRPIEFLNFAYTHYDRFSELCVWYKFDGVITSDVEQADGWFIDGCIINYDVNLDKRALAFEFMTEIAPETVYINTKKYSSFNMSDFKARGDYWISSVKNNVVGGVNSGQTSRIFGSYFSIKLAGSSRIYQNLYNFILKCLVKSRTYKT